MSAEKRRNGGDTRRSHFLFFISYHTEQQSMRISDLAMLSHIKKKKKTWDGYIMIINFKFMKHGHI